MVIPKYRWDFIGLSSQDKPTPETSNKVVDGSTFYECDTSKLYVYCQDGWYERQPLGGSGTADFEQLSNRPKYNGEAMTGSTDIPEVISSSFTGATSSSDGVTGLVPAPLIADVNKFLKGNGNWETIDGGLPTLTTADYNFPTTGTKTRIVLAYLEPGVYTVKKDGNGDLPVIALRDSTNDLGYLEGDIIVVLRPRTTSTNYRVIIDVYRQSSTEYGGTLYFTDGATSKSLNLLGAENVIDNLTSNIAYFPLSAKQGKVLNDKIGELSSLTTTDKTSIVAAINELASRL